MSTKPLPTVSLWNPRWTIIWSLIFTPVFGALLQKKNWLEMGKTDEAAQSGTWVTFGLVLYFGYLLGEPFFPDTRFSQYYFIGMNIVFLILWAALSARQQVAEVRSRYGENYHHKLWGKPLMFAGMAVILWLALSLTYILALILGGVIDAGTLQNAVTPPPAAP